MIYSIRRFLLINLLVAITVISSLNAAGTYFLDKIAIQKHLDIELQQITGFLRLLLIRHPSKNELKKLQQLMLHKNLIMNFDASAQYGLLFPMQSESYFQIVYSQ